ncbi:histidine kinase [Microbacterium sp.]|uniref:sensor histidine kinase n=1 Tax=Microbacterium sp. TaxID=51671 RepID=UPI00261A90F4|nr:histidine kinase [Microbacterium sp.]
MSHIRSAIVRFGEILRLDSAPPLNRAEGVTSVLTLFAVLVVGGVMISSDPDVTLTQAVFDRLLTVLFLTFFFSPTLAIALFAVAMAASFPLDVSGEAFSALAIATGAVTRLGSPLLMMMFSALLMVSAAGVTLNQSSADPPMVALGLLIAAAAGSFGLILRTVRSREHMFSIHLETQAAAFRDARREERLMLADELHDVIAHDLTAIAMQARVMDHETDPVLRAQTQQEIGDSARRALHDLRRLIAREEMEQPSTRADGLQDTVESTALALRTAGHRVQTDICFEHPLPRLIDVTLSRVLRESTTNVMKHSDPGCVSIRVVADSEAISLEIRNTLGRPISRDIPSGGYGMVRLNERVTLMGGQFSSQAHEKEWVATATIPLI